jgi:hypothetical protein
LVVVECERGGGDATEARCDGGHAAAVESLFDGGDLLLFLDNELIIGNVESRGWIQVES